MKSICAILLISIFLQSYLAQTGNSFKYGVDVSALPEVEDNGAIFKINGVTKDALQIFKENGINYCRLRIWHTPSSPYCNLTKTLLMAKRIKEKGLKLMLDFHFSDTWADPGNQKKPFAWENLSFDLLKDSLYNYTKNVMTALRNQNTIPSIVQIGNEIICGMLWNECKVCDPFNTSLQWSKFSVILNEGIRAVKESVQESDSVKLMIHIDRGGDNVSSRWFYDKLLSYKVDFDIIGLSYYPWWHGTFANLKTNMDDLAKRYNKEIIVVETAYPWTLGWNDNTNNIVGNASQLHSGYAASVDGQKKFLLDLISQIKTTPNNKGIGLFYWAPDWISTKTSGSPWENLALFDFSGEVLNSITAFSNTTVIENTEEKIAVDFMLHQNFPNPFNPTTVINYQISAFSHVTLKVYDVLGREVTTLVSDYRQPGYYSSLFTQSSAISSNVYFYQLTVVDNSVNPGHIYVETKKMILVK